MRTKFIVLSLFFTLGYTSYSQNYVEPSIKSSTSFAIIVDKDTYLQAQEEILSYKESIEKDGLATYIVYHNWDNPSQIREILHKLHQHNKHPLEGTVLIGDIPVVMIRGAQPLTSTFKMPETVSWIKSSVASDRYYDDLNLEFDFLKKEEDSNYKNVFYYQLSTNSPHHISMSIYSGRIKPPSIENGKTALEQIKDYLQKAVKVKANTTTLQNMIVSTGHGYNSNSTISWANEILALRSSFSTLFTPKNSIKFLNHRNSTFMKNQLLNELKNKDLDLAFMTGHGSADLQLLNGYPEVSNPQPSMENVARYIRSKMNSAKQRNRDLEVTKKNFQESLGLNDKWFNDAFSTEMYIKDSIFNQNLDIHIDDIQNINAKIAYLNSCLTGSFHLDNYLAGHYPFSGGNNIVTIANSVGVLQDLWGIQLLGTLQHGQRIGHILQKTAYLETHIFGDPTFHFSPSMNINLTQQPTKESEWQKLLKTPDADVQALALTELFKLSKEEQFSKVLLHYMNHSTYETVRTQAYLLLREYQNKDYRTAVLLALNDNYEYLKRKAIYDVIELGDDQYIDPILDLYINEQEAKRLQHKISWLFQFINHDKAILLLDKKLQNNSNLINAQELYDSAYKKLSNEKNKVTEYLKVVDNNELTDKELVATLRTFRAYRYHQIVPMLINIASDNQRSDLVRSNALEALSWYGLSYQKEKIITACNSLLQTEQSEEVLRQIKHTLAMIESAKLRQF